MEKALLSHASAVVVIYRASDPRYVFMDRKDQTHPRIYCRGGHCPIGGNRTKSRLHDRGPLELALGEFSEEFGFYRFERNSGEYKETGLVDKIEHFVATPISGAEITEEDEDVHYLIVQVVARTAVPYQDFLSKIPNSVIIAAEPNYDPNKPEDWSLCTYFEAGLDETIWKELERLQKKFGNLSNESQSEIFFLPDMLLKGDKGSFQHGISMQTWWADKGYKRDAARLTLLPGVVAQPFGKPLATWAEYDETFDFKVKP